MCENTHTHTYIYGAAPPRRRPPPPKPRLSFQQTVIRHPRNCPPKPHGTTRQGTTGAGWGRITHNTGNHRAPSPSPPLRHTDDNDGDDVVHNDVDVLFPVWLLVVPFLLCCSGLRQRMFIALFSRKSCLACDVLAETVSAVCHSKPSFGRVRFHARLSTCLNDFHSGLLSKGPEESADGDHDHHLRHHHHHNIHHYQWLWSSGQVGTVSHPKVQTLSNRMPDTQPAIAMEGGAADRNHSGKGQGGTHTTGNHRGEGGYHGVGGGGGA